MSENQEEAIKRVVQHLAYEGMKGAGCMVTLLAMLTGIKVLEKELEQSESEKNEG